MRVDWVKHKLYISEGGRRRLEELIEHIVAIRREVIGSERARGQLSSEVGVGDQNIQHGRLRCQTLTPQLNELIIQPQRMIIMMMINKEIKRTITSKRIGSNKHQISDSARDLVTLIDLIEQRASKPSDILSTEKYCQSEKQLEGTQTNCIYTTKTKTNPFERRDPRLDHDGLGAAAVEQSAQSLDRFDFKDLVRGFRVQQVDAIHRHGFRLGPANTQQ